MSYEEKIKELKINLPDAKAPVGNYVATKVSGKLIGNPVGKFTLYPGMILIYLGSQEQLERIKEILREVLIKAGWARKDYLSNEW